MSPGQVDRLPATLRHSIGCWDFAQHWHRIGGLIVGGRRTLLGSIHSGVGFGGIPLFGRFILHIIMADPPIIGGLIRVMAASWLLGRAPDDGLLGRAPDDGIHRFCRRLGACDNALGSVKLLLARRLGLRPT